MDGYRHRKKTRFMSGLAVVLIFLAVSFAYGSYFYLRNWILTGNPTGIYHVEIAGTTFFEGTEDVSSHFNWELMPSSLYQALKEGSEWPIVLDGFYDPQVVFTQGNRIGGWGAVWTILLLPAIPIALFWALIRKRWRVIAVIAVCLLPYFLFKYNHTWLRYHLIVLVSGTVAFGYIISLLERTRLREVLLASAGILMLMTLLISGAQVDITPADISSAREHVYLKKDRYIYFNSWNDPAFATALNSEKRAGTTLAASDLLPMEKQLAFWNRYYTNRVVWIEWSEPGENWYARLVDAGADSVYVAKDSVADTFAESNPFWFSPVYSGANGAIYEVLRPELNE
jgi:hypothetical protein